jgi:hypothetical protein
MITFLQARALLRACALGMCLSGAWVTQTASLAAKPAAPAADAAEVTFLGYQALPGGRGLLFVDLTRSVEVEVTRAGPVIEYKLVGASVPRRNNKNPLLLRDFASSAIAAVLVPAVRGKADRKKHEAPSVRFVVTLRGKTQPTHRLVGHGKGARLEIELPAPSGS